MPKGQGNTKSKREISRKPKITGHLPGTIVTNAKFSPGKVTVPFENSEDLSRKLLRLSSHLAAARGAAFAGPAATDGDQILGPMRANVIVENCANSTNLDLTLGQLMLDGQLFRSCIADQIQKAGFVPPDDIPTGSDTKLIDVATTIELARRAN